MARERAAVVVVGAGAAGLATARELARAGRRPLVLERFALGHDRGSSHGSSRIVRLAHDREDDVREALEAYALWDRLERDTGTRLRLTVGGLDFGGFVEPTARALGACGVRYERLSPADVERRFPAVRAHGQDALLQPDGAVGLADITLKALARDAVAHGATIREHTPVTGLETGAAEGPVTLRTPGGDVQAQSVVLATGPWIGELTRMSGTPLPVRATLQTPVHLALAAAPLGTVPTVIEEDAAGQVFYALPQPEGGAVKGGLHLPGPDADLEGGRDAEDATAGPFRAWAAGRLRGVGRELQAYGCIYTWLPGDRFHLTRTGRVVTVSCCSGRGFKFTPLIGARAAGLAEEALR
ncbi:Monomeric sarcosine oxidase [Paraconexibacter sp. AEG42_29]|uniref:Monomeric sarcosine oxidase n=1 Tax=Paraconexibacter sp. AEG42_29 TaxID=2997339 RepID=A0AAU7ATQ2_9ACTN